MQYLTILYSIIALHHLSNKCRCPSFSSLVTMREPSTPPLKVSTSSQSSISAKTRTDVSRSPTSPVMRPSPRWGPDLAGPSGTWLTQMTHDLINCTIYLLMKLFLCILHVCLIYGIFLCVSIYSHRRVYDFIGTFLTTGMRFLLNKQVCLLLPADDISLLINWMTNYFRTHVSVRFVLFWIMLH